VADPIEVEITATDNASETIDEIAAKADELEGRDLEVQVGADTAEAESGLGDVEQAAEGLEGEAVEIDVTADTSAAVSGLGDVEAGAGRAGGAIDRMGKGAGSVSTVADQLHVMGGSIGDVADGAGLAADGFRTGSAAAGTLAEKMGASSAAAGPLAAGIGAGVAVIALGVQKWQEWKKEQEAAAKLGRDLGKDLLEGQKAMAQGDANGVVDAANDAYERLRDTLEGTGANAADAWKFLNNPDDKAALDELGESADLNAMQMINLANRRVEAREEADNQRTAEDELRQALEDQRAGLDTTIEGLGLLNEARINAANASIAQGDAERGFVEAVAASRTAQAELDAAIAEHGPASAEAAAATENLGRAVVAERDAAISSAEGTARLAAERARATGATWDSTDAVHAMNGSLLQSAQVATPAARGEIERYIAEVNGIPPEKATLVTAAVAGVSAAEGALAQLARDRTATINVAVHAAAGGLAGAGAVLQQQSVGNPGGQPAATGPTATPAAVAGPVWAPTIHVNIDARGAVDPYTIGDQVEGVLERWAGVAGTWRPGRP
jgi:hypothetical protein